MSRKLHNPQVEMFHQIRSQIIDNQHRNRGIAVAPPGFGKTSVITACFDYIASINAHKGVGLMITPRLILNAQQSDELEQLEIDGFPNVPKTTITFDSSIPNGLSIERVKQFITDSHNNNKYPIIVSTYKSCGKLHSINFDIMFCDEGHNVVSQSVFNSVMGRLNPKIKRVFITATPKFGVSDKDVDLEELDVEDDDIDEIPSNIRRQARGMNNKEMYGDIVYSMSFPEAVRRGIILRIQPITLNGYGNPNSAEHVVDIVINSAITMKLEMDGVPLPSKTLFALDRTNAGRQILAIHTDWAKIKDATGCDVYTAFSKGEDFRKNGVKFYSGRDCPDVRTAFIRDFKNNKNDAIIVHYGTMGEGVDVTGITATVLFPTDDVIRIIQNMGRAMRVLPEDRMLPKSKRVKKRALIGMFSFNGEDSSQQFQLGIAEALHQLTSERFFKKYLTSVITDNNGGSMVIEGETESIEQHSLEEFNSYEIEELDVINDEPDELRQMLEDKERQLIMDEMLEKAKMNKEKDIADMSKWL